MNDKKEIDPLLYPYEKHEADINLYQSMLIQTVIDLAHTVKVTDLESNITRHLPKVSKALFRERDNRLTFGCARSNLNPERCRQSSKRSIVLFYVANAIMAFYDFVGNRHIGTAMMQYRINRLNWLTKLGLHNFTVEGNDRDGFYLFNAKANDELKDRPLAASEQAMQALEQDTKDRALQNQRPIPQR